VKLCTDLDRTLLHVLIFGTYIQLSHESCRPIHTDRNKHTRLALVSDMVWLHLIGSIKLQVSFAKEPYKHTRLALVSDMVWLHLIGSIKLQVSFAKEPYKRDAILQKRHII